VFGYRTFFVVSRWCLRKKRIGRRPCCPYARQRPSEAAHKRVNTSVDKITHPTTIAVSPCPHGAAKRISTARVPYFFKKLGREDVYDRIPIKATHHAPKPICSLAHDICH
jgi:hypothetical protein